MPSAHPRLRDDIDASPLRHQGQDLYVLFDQAAFSPARLAASPLVLWVMARLDGTVSVLDLYDRLLAESNPDASAPSLADLMAVVDALDQALFLEGPRFDDFYDQLQRDFLASSERQATSAGAVYPDDPAELAASLNRILANAPPDETPAAPSGIAPYAAIAPHIDYARGGAGYGQLYRHMAKCRPPESVVVLGVAHRSLNASISLCDKDFAIPGDHVLCDRARVSQLAALGKKHGQNWHEDAFAHRMEHSIELQAVWIHHVWQYAKIIPILVDCPDDDTIRSLAELFADWMTVPGGVMLVASVDLAHLGPRFGDERAVSDPFLGEVEVFDRARLSEWASGLSKTACEAVRDNENKYHWCGMGALSVLSRCLGERSGSLLGYHQAATPELEQAVSFASMIYA